MGGCVGIALSTTSGLGSFPLLLRKMDSGHLDLVSIQHVLAATLWAAGAQQKSHFLPNLLTSMVSSGITQGHEQQGQGPTSGPCTGVQSQELGSTPFPHKFHHHSGIFLHEQGSAPKSALIGGDSPERCVPGTCSGCPLTTPPPSPASCRGHPEAAHLGRRGG